MRPRLSKIGVPYTELWAATVDADADREDYAATFDAAADDENVELAIELGGLLTGKTPLTVCLDDVELNDPQFEAPDRPGAPGVPVRVNQVGYLPGFAKIATVATKATAPVDWQLVDRRGKVRASGKTPPFGEDRSSGERVQQIDFSSVTAPGKGCKLRVGKDESLPFEIGDDVYQRLKYDALSFFYLQRSGVPIKMPYAGTTAYARPPGHLGDKSVPCAPEAGCTTAWTSAAAGTTPATTASTWSTVASASGRCRTSTRRWRAFGTTAGDFGDGKMNIPEGSNGIPDLLDEARFNLEFMLRMQVPAGKPHAGMAHHKIHGESWTDPDHADKDDMKRFLRPVSTAATLDLAATAAQAARLWKKLDPAFAARCLAAAEMAFAAAPEDPMICRRAERSRAAAPTATATLDDEFYWAATELFITTGKPAYKDDLDRSRFHAPKARRRDGGRRARLGSRGPAGEAEPGRRAQRAGRGGASPSCARRSSQPPIASSAPSKSAATACRWRRRPYIWGSNGGVMNAALVLGTAYDLHPGREVRQRA